jgi:hypothetical protein
MWGQTRLVARSCSHVPDSHIINCILRVELSALSCALMSGPRRVRPGAIALVILAIAGTLSACDSDSSSPQLANGWVTNCSGPDFSKFSQTSSTGPGSSRPVFRVTDQLVLAVPKGNWPSAGRIEHQPRKCRAISDLPQVHYLYFVIQGNWSGVYNPNDVPLAGGKKAFLPDAVTVRVEREPPSKLSTEEQRGMDQIGAKHWNDLPNKREIGGWICGRYFMPRDPNTKGGWTCHGQRAPSDPDTIRVETKSYKSSPFVLLDADYESSHYGGIHVYWMVWTLDVAHARDIDQAIWNSLTEWNLIDNNDTPSSPR